MGRYLDIVRQAQLRALEVSLEQTTDDLVREAKRGSLQAGTFDFVEASSIWAQFVRAAREYYDAL